MRQIGATDDDIKLLIAKRYILIFDSGIIVIKHWRLNNYLQKDRLKPTTYQEELSTLTFDKKGAYIEKENADIPCIQGDESDVYTGVYTQDSIGKYSIVKSSIEEDSIGKGIVKGETPSCPPDMGENWEKAKAFIREKMNGSS